MNEKFLALPEEKKQRIINSAMQVFSKNEYKRASTDDISALAGISKGLLFYYFHNKKSLYLYIYEYSAEIARTNICNENYEKIDDFFELLFHSMNAKMKILKTNPYIYDFSLRAYFETDKTVREDISMYNETAINSSFEKYFKNINFNKFKTEVNPEHILKMVYYMFDGYMREQARTGMKDLEIIKADITSWLQIIKNSVYKEAYL
ncbi:TetR/AcrR family transcriptional regulator [Clostridium cellulovorans]|uniref:Transcriptional regulator, TetR family n=1 Tax=Clostridium cellulovorans (strain ATCC 35296 / DSM 3052 / OCM 3 / 743B) TaxID=573061 RepID=D9SQI1_CLOC7|nr:TetR/AcrR family transcriptional regulator [Clostridium cellulovorans]ADL50248.1 transcriptional regulator, TetR family [Clostridium cellulovorans 743B]